MNEVQLVGDLIMLKNLRPVALAFGAVGSVVVRNLDVRSPQVVKAFVNMAGDAFISEGEVSKWPGTHLLEGTAHLIKFEISAESWDIISQHYTTLSDFEGPSKPEDLCLYRADGTVLLISITHERDFSLYLKPTEEALFKNESSAL
jgi:hypothetical protein